MPYDLTHYRYVSDYELSFEMPQVRCRNPNIETLLLQIACHRWNFFLYGWNGYAVRQYQSSLRDGIGYTENILQSHWFANLARTSHEVNANYSFSHSYNKLLEQIDFIS